MRTGLRNVRAADAVTLNGLVQSIAQQLTGIEVFGGHSGNAAGLPIGPEDADRLRDLPAIGRAPSEAHVPAGLAREGGQGTDAAEAAAHRLRMHHEEDRGRAVLRGDALHGQEAPRPVFPRGAAPMRRRTAATERLKGARRQPLPRRIARARDFGAAGAFSEAVVHADLWRVITGTHGAEGRSGGTTGPRGVQRFRGQGYRISQISHVMLLNLILGGLKRGFFL